MELVLGWGHLARYVALGHVPTLPVVTGGSSPAQSLRGSLSFLKHASGGSELLHTPPPMTLCILILVLSLKCPGTFSLSRGETAFPFRAQVFLSEVQRKGDWLYSGTGLYHSPLNTLAPRVHGPHVSTGLCPQVCVPVCACVGGLSWCHTSYNHSS